MELKGLTVKELKAIATQRQIPGRSKATRKVDIIALIQDWLAKEDEARETVSKAIAQTPDAWHGGKRLASSHALMMAIMCSVSPNWQTVAKDLSTPIRVTKNGDFAIAYGADAIKLAIQGECPLMIHGYNDNLQSGFPLHVLESYKSQLSLILD